MFNNNFIFKYFSDNLGKAELQHWIFKIKTIHQLTLFLFCFNMDYGCTYIIHRYIKNILTW